MNPSIKKSMALTFDDGPSDTIMVQIMDILSQYGAKATFFVVGRNITESNQGLLMEALERGFEIGNHSQSHLHMTELTREEIQREVSQVQAHIGELTGVEPVLFRAPYLDVDEKLLNTVPLPFISGYSNCDWDPACTVSQRIELARKAARDGGILLMHCFEGNEATVEALKILLPELKQQNYDFLTVSQLFAKKGVLPQNGVVYESVKS